MPAVTASELTRLRTDFSANWFVESCAISRPTSASDGRGGHTDTYTTVATVMCRRTGPNISAANEAPAADRMQSSIEWVVSLPAGTSVQPKDRLVISGRTYEVNADLDRTTEIARYVVATEIA